MKAVILAAGKGTRMQGLSGSRPKPMVPVLGRPLLDWVLDRISTAGIREFIVVIGHLGSMIEQHLSDDSSPDRQISFLRQTNPNGTGGAVQLCREAVGNSSFLLSFGDILAPKSHYPRMVQRFRETSPDLLLSVNRVEDPSAGAAVYLDDDDRVTRLVEKPPRGTSSTYWNNGGIFIFTPLVFEYTARLSPSPRGEYELTDAITAMMDDGRDVRAVPIEGTRCDLTKPEDLPAVEEILRSQGEESPV